MTDRELAARIAVVTEVMLCFGVVDEARIEAIVNVTSGIPWYVPEFRGNEDAGDPLFPLAVQLAGGKKTYGAPGPGDITEAAMTIAGTVTSDQGHNSPRRWVRIMNQNPAPLGMSREQMMSIDAPGRKQIGGGDNE